jgi:hypothetical protein
MQVSGVDKKDSIMLANFLNSLKLGKFPDAQFGHIVALVDGTRWLENLFKLMADDLVKKEIPEEEKTFKIKEYNPGQV